MSNEEKLIEIVTSHKPDINVTNITKETKLEELNIESLTFIEIIYDVETEFNCEIPDDKLTDLKTLGDFLTCIDSYKENVVGIK